MIFQNFIVQITALLLGIIGGIIVSWIAQEELEMYAVKIGTAARIAFIITLLLPLIFSQSYIVIGFIAFTYCILGIWWEKEGKVFFWLSPLSAILCSQTQTGFFTILAFIFIATLLSTSILLAAETKNQKIHWNKKLISQSMWVYLPFIIISVVCYAALSIISLRSVLQPFAFLCFFVHIAKVPRDHPL